MAAPEEVLERALFAQADLVIPGSDGLHRIRAGIIHHAARRDGRWWRRALRRALRRWVTQPATTHHTQPAPGGSAPGADPGPPEEGL